MEETKKITQEELNSIVAIQNKLAQTLQDIGVLESQKHALLHKIADVNEDVETLKKELEKQYGAVNINVEDGTYTKIENEEEVAVGHV